MSPGLAFVRLLGRASETPRLSARAPCLQTRALAAKARPVDQEQPRGGGSSSSSKASHIRVKAEVENFGRLAGGLLARAMRGEKTEIDALGDAAVSNAIKAVALANAFGIQQSQAPIRLAFEPILTEASLDRTSKETKKLVRLVVRPQQGSSFAEDHDFSRGGIYVSAGSQENSKSTTPSQLAKTALGEWSRFAAPDLRQATRAAAARKAASGGKDASATAFSASVQGRKQPPFLVAMGPPAISRGVKALAFVCADLKKDHLAGIPALLVEPRLWVRTKTEASGKEKESRLMVFCMIQALSKKAAR